MEAIGSCVDSRRSFSFLRDDGTYPTSFAAITQIGHPASLDDLINMCQDCVYPDCDN
jgi:hypothetical protein